MLAIFLVLCYASLALSLPAVQLGTTKLVGTDLALSQLEFFGGRWSSLSEQLLIESIKVFHSLNRL